MTIPSNKEPTTEELLKALQELNISKNAKLAGKAIDKMLPDCYVPKFSKGDERPPEEKDFVKSQPVNEENLVQLSTMLKHLAKLEGSPEVNKILHNKEILMAIIIIAGENNTKYPWNSNTTVQACMELLDTFVTFNGGQSVDNVIVTNKLLRPLLLTLRPKLMGTAWKHHPAALQCYVWLLHKVKQPQMLSHINEVIPTAVSLTDDFANDNRILGTQCLHHIIQNMTVSELESYGHGEMILNAVDRLMHVRDAALVNTALPCLITLLTNMETDLGSVPQVRQWSRFDDLLETVLRNMQLEHVNDLRDVYISHLKHIIHSSGYRIIRWSKRLLHVFNEYLEVSLKHDDLKTTLACLEAMECYLQISRPIVLFYANCVLFLLLKTIYCIISSATPADDTEGITNTAVSCLSIVLARLSSSDKKGLKLSLNEKLRDTVDCHFVTFLNSIF